MADESESARMAKLAFENALEAQLPSDSGVEDLINSFERSAFEDENGNPFWSARDLQQLLGYADYRNFLNIVDKAKAACANALHDPDDHFVDITEMVIIGSGAAREIDDIRLSRYACYLIAQNGDARKKPIAFAQTYFAIQTRRQEIRDAEPDFGPLTEDQKRSLLRDEIKTHNKNLASAAKSAGVVQPIDYAIFQTYGYKGLYGGLDKKGIQRRKRLATNQDILDHMGSTELAANLFRATQTEEKLRRDETQGKDATNKVHYEVGAKVRQTIKDIGGTMPEELPAAEDIKKVQRRLKATNKNKLDK